MPRTARVDYQGAMQHVCIRGLERRSIFSDDADRERFLEYLQRALVEAGNPCLAWALMPNHVHLLMESRNTPLPRVMRRIGTGYATAFNRRHGRAGYLFQNRYYSRAVESDDYLLTAACYILRNPLVAGIVKDLEALESYPWTGYPALLGGRRRPFQDVEGMLEAMGGTPEQARSRLRARMAEVTAPDDAWEVDLDALVPPSGGAGGGGGRERPHDGGWRPGGQRHPEWSVDRLLGDVCRILQVDEDALRAGRRLPGVSEARALVAHLGHEVLGYPLSVLGSATGVSGVAMGMALSRGRRVRESQHLRLTPGSGPTVERVGTE